MTYELTDDFNDSLRRAGITAKTILAYEKRLAAAARYKKPNSKFGNVDKAVTLVKDLVDTSEPYGDRIRLEYTETSAVLTVNTYILVVRPDKMTKLKELTQYVDFIEISPHDDYTVCIEMEIKDVFDLPDYF